MSKVKYNLETIRHSAAHLLATAILEMFPEAQMWTWPSTNDWFYYDFLLPRTLIPEDLLLIEKKMKHIAKQKIKFEQYNEPIEESIKFLKASGQDLKVEIASDLEKTWENELSFYKSWNFVDLCSGPHVENTFQTWAFKLTKISGSYFRWDKEKAQLQRIYWVCFETKEDLKLYEERMREAKKRDHRVIWKKLWLFTFSEKVWAGLPLFTQKWTRIRNAVVNEIKKLQVKYWYWFSDVTIPHITKKDLYECSGHWEKYKEDLFHVSWKSDTQFVMKPMNCPHHTQIFDAEPRSYRDLPIRMTEVTACYRDEQAWELSWISRVRGFTQDDWHIFCTVDQIKSESKKIVNIIKDFYTKLWMFDEWKYRVSLSVRDSKDLSKYLWEEKNWDKAENFLKEVAEETWLNFERVEWEAAFYGPKLDFMFKDAIGREWQLATIQCDFVMPERFELEYIWEDWEKHRPVMIHRAIAGSLERFMSIIIEHFSWAFPVWLAPVHSAILPVAPAHEEYANEVFKELKDEFYIEYLEPNESLWKRMRKSEMQKYPYSIIIWDKEVESKKITVRNYADKSQKEMTIEEFKELLKS